MKQKYCISPSCDAITCQVCGVTSNDEQDILHKYCKNCGLFLEDYSHCDFCAEVCSEGKTYIAKTKMQMLLLSKAAEVVDNGEWLACKICSAAIDTKDWEKLIARGIAGAEHAMQTTFSGERMNNSMQNMLEVINNVFGVKIRLENTNERKAG